MNAQTELKPSTVPLIQSYVQERYFVSTVYRPSSCEGMSHYYETIAWEWDARERKRGDVVRSLDSGYERRHAFASHATVCEELTANVPDPETLVVSR